MPTTSMPRLASDAAAIAQPTRLDNNGGQHSEFDQHGQLGLFKPSLWEQSSFRRMAGSEEAVAADALADSDAEGTQATWTPPCTQPRHAKMHRGRRVRRSISCHADCTQWNGVVSYEAWGAAGLRDRAWMIAGLANLAVSLCARLAVPPPCELLARVHNHAAAIPCNRSWDFYLNFTLLPEGSNTRVLYERRGILRFPELRFTASRPSTLILEPPGMPRSSALSPGAEKRFKARLEELAEANRSATLQLLRVQYSQAAKAAAEGRPFIWRILTSSYVWARHLLPQPRADAPQPNLQNACPFSPRLVAASTSGCAYVKQWPTRTSEQLRDRLLARLQLEKKKFAVLHIRRLEKGAVRRMQRNRCNTSAGRIAAISHLLMPDAPLLLFTDDKSKEYLSQVKQAIAANGPRVRLLHGDYELEKEASAMEAAGDNYIIFSAMLDIFQAGVGLHVCEDCPHGDPASCTAAIGARLRDRSETSSLRAAEEPARLPGGLLKYWGFKCARANKVCGHAVTPT